MAELESPPFVPTHDEKLEKGSAEKSSNDSVEIATSIQGDVYDDIRAIDLGEDGKERPIGM